MSRSGQRGWHTGAVGRRQHAGRPDHALTKCAGQVVAQEAILPVGEESQGVAERRPSDAVRARRAFPGLAGVRPSGPKVTGGQARWGGPARAFPQKLLWKSRQVPPVPRASPQPSGENAWVFPTGLWGKVVKCFPQTVLGKSGQERLGGFLYN